MYPLPYYLGLPCKNRMFTNRIHTDVPNIPRKSALLLFISTSKILNSKKKKKKARVSVKPAFHNYDTYLMAVIVEHNISWLYVIGSLRCAGERVGLSEYNAKPRPRRT